MVVRDDLWLHVRARARMCARSPRDHGGDRRARGRHRVLTSQLQAAGTTSATVSASRSAPRPPAVATPPWPVLRDPRSVAASEINNERDVWQSLPPSIYPG